MKARKRRKRAIRAARTPIEREERLEVGPTPETARHAQEIGPDPIQDLVENHWIDTAGEHAAAEIEAIYRALTNKLDLKTMKLSAIPHGSKDIADSLDRAHAERYLPWSSEIGGVVFGLVISTVVRRVYTTNAKLKAVVADALQNYARRM